MKTRFSTLDIIAILPELKAKLCTGWRVNQVYDCDQKTYLFKLNKSIVKMKKDDDPLSVNEETANKMTFIIESGLRMHSTDYDWPKSHAPSHFATKLRKHIRNKRIEDIRQVGVDRLVDIQFGSNLAANHLIIELYDRGNLILTEHDYTIITILRWRKPIQNEKVKDVDTKDIDSKDSENLKIGQVYPLESSRKLEDLDIMSEDKIVELLNDARNILGKNFNYKKRNKLKQSDDGCIEINLKDLFNPYLVYGSSLLEDRLLTHVFNNDPSIKKCSIKLELEESGKFNHDSVRKYAKLIKIALDDAEEVLEQVKKRQKSPGYLVQKKQNSDISQKISENKKNSNNKDENNESKAITTNVNFFPIQSCAQRKIDQEPSNLIYVEYESFDKAVDIYYSNLESQKLDSKALVAEKEAMKKLDNLKLAQEKRLQDLGRVQKEDEEKGRLIELNCDKVEDALLIIRSMIANQVPWSDIWSTIKEAQAMKDPIASSITQVKFDRNEFSMRLNDPYEDSDNEDESENQKKKKDKRPKFKVVDIDIGLSAHANARKFFVKRRFAVNKEKKAIEVSKKAFKNVERQTKEKLKEVVVTTNITKARKRYWFENFFWFISSDGYLIVAGREAEQNDLLVKRYMKNNDIYVHADLHGASSVIIKNETADPIPPKTLVEAGTMAVCYSSAWDSKIATASWWVYPKQVSKTAPAGEYLGVGAFLIRGKKNFLPLSNLVLGFGFLFRLEEDSIERKKAERLSRQTTHFDQVNTVNSTEDSKEDLSVGDDDESIESNTDEFDSEETSGKTHNGSLPATDNGDEQALIQEGENGPLVDDDFDEYDEDNVGNKVVEHRLIDTLTESPSTDDILLYAIPMCGPYSALSDFKYKVKVIPGANKRGKAAKACLGMFLHDKRATQREKDLLRALKDQDYARNIPNKVKISAANMKTMTKKRPKKSEVRLPM